MFSLLPLPSAQPREPSLQIRRARIHPGAETVVGADADAASCTYSRFPMLILHVGGDRWMFGIMVINASAPTRARTHTPGASVFPHQMWLRVCWGRLFRFNFLLGLISLLSHEPLCLRTHLPQYERNNLSKGNKGGFALILNVIYASIFKNDNQHTTAVAEIIFFFPPALQFSSTPLEKFTLHPCLTRPTLKEPPTQAWG